ncbi:hypothetical protein GF406_22510 [candidate division KSB1 bacterium]|nr:hypothetical protein [candidate division KSB1 bacterium]
MLIYSLLMAEFFNTFNSKIFSAQPHFSPNTLFTYLMTLNYVLMIVMSFVIWIATSFLFHLFAVLFDGQAEYKNFQKVTGLAYGVPAVFILIAIVLIDRVQVSQNNFSNFLKTDETIRNTGWLMNTGGMAYYFVIIPVIKYLYNISWLRSIGVITIPMASIYLLGQFFVKFIF